jgi:mono/diheme cytochrome c family protein
MFIPYFMKSSRAQWRRDDYAAASRFCHDLRRLSRIRPFARLSGFGRRRLIDMVRLLHISAAAILAIGPAALAQDAGAPVDFNREIRPLLTNNCFRCHGPDEKERKGGKGGLRLDTAAGAAADLGGTAAVVPGKPEQSELLRRVSAADDERMPPAKSGPRLKPDEVELLRRWIRQGAPYPPHWAYARPARPPRPTVRQSGWARHDLDYFVLKRLEDEKLRPSPEADRASLIRRASLDLTGLPPAPADVDAFLKDPSPNAYEALVDKLLASPAYGEHWAQLWLDLARYADSAGYADDPLRTIWAYRDWVIRALNDNMPFDRFTLEQIAGDLLPNPTEDQLLATAFHRNTLTNNEGGTSDEEFRNVAVVDRVNTTLAIWMGTTMACAQCHHHKYDPIKQEEFFRVFAFFNNTEDNDQPDERPTHKIFTPEQKRQRAAWSDEIARLEQSIRDAGPEQLAEGQERWEQTLRPEFVWVSPAPANPVSTGGATLAVQDDGSILVGGASPATDTTRVDLPGSLETLTALRLEVLPDASLPGGGPGRAGNGNFVLSRLSLTAQPPAAYRPAGKIVRVEIPGAKKVLSLAEVQLFSGEENVAVKGAATQSSTDHGGEAARAIDGVTDGDYFKANSTTHTKVETDPWWQVELSEPAPLDRIVVWNRTDGDVKNRLTNFRVRVMDAAGRDLWEQEIGPAPDPSATLALNGPRRLRLSAAIADHSQEGFGVEQAVKNADLSQRGWAIGSQTGKPHAAAFVLARPAAGLTDAVLTVTLEQVSVHPNHTLGRFRLGLSDDPRGGTFLGTPPEIVALTRTEPGARTPEQRTQLFQTYHAIAPELKPSRDRLAELTRSLDQMPPVTTLPIMRELAADQRRKTHLQIRGNFLDLGAEVTPGTPAAFNPFPADQPLDRLGLARWLMSADNPLTARVTVNRFWEQLFGTGLVRTSEDFGIQGEAPSHPELLDWLATEFVGTGWDVKKLLRLIVTSATYRQSARASDELVGRDPENRLLARGPRVRLSAEMVRDQALFAAGLLSRKMYGPPVQPPRPKLGLSAAFGGSTDWETSAGEDRYRRALYTMWRRSSPYPSMDTFDAPTREVCTVRRSRTNTPLQALVTLNDPVYVEAAQALARRITAEGGPDEASRAAYGFRLCLARAPREAERDRLVTLYREARRRYTEQPDQAVAMATDPLGPAPEGADVTDLAAWTVVGNVLLNLDEMVLKP